MQDKTPINEKGQRHGYWETYYSNGKPHYKGNFINGKLHRYGLWELSNNLQLTRIYYAR